MIFSWIFICFTYNKKKKKQFKNANSHHSCPNASIAIYRNAIKFILYKKKKLNRFLLFILLHRNTGDRCYMFNMFPIRQIYRIKFIILLSDRGFVNNHSTFIRYTYDQFATMVFKNPLQLRFREIITSRANSCIINERKSVCLRGDTRVWDRAVILYDCKI